MGIKGAVAAAAIGITGIGLLTACGWEPGTESYSDTHDVEQSFTSLRFAGDAGNVTIRTGDSTSVERTVHYRDDKPGEDTFRVRDGVLELNSCGKPGCSIDYEVTVPAETTVAGETDSGSADIAGVAEANVKADSGEVTISDVAGKVAVTADSGAVTLNDIGGSVVAKADSGNLTVDGVEGDVTMHSSSGSVEARGVGGAAAVESDSGNVVVELTNSDDVQVDAESGAVEVTVPDGSYQVSTSTDSGNVENDIDNDPSGEHRLDLHTDSGNISVTPA